MVLVLDDFIWISAVLLKNKVFTNVASIENVVTMRVGNKSIYRFIGWDC
jgi:hypothetical protein